MLDHPQHNLRKVEHLPSLRRDHRRVGQRAPAAAARAWRVHYSLVRYLDLAQRPPLVPGLPTGRPVGAFPPRPRRWLLIALTRRRLVRVARVLPEPSLQLSDPVNKRHQLLDERRVLLAQRGILLPQQDNCAVPLSQTGPRLGQLSAQPSNIGTCLCHQPAAYGGSRSQPRSPLDRTPRSLPIRRR